MHIFSVERKKVTSYLPENGKVLQENAKFIGEQLCECKGFWRRYKVLKNNAKFFELKKKTQKYNAMFLGKKQKSSKRK